MPPPVHLTTSKVMVIVCRLKGNVIRTVLYIATVLPLQWAQLTKTVHTARLGRELVFFVFFGVEWFFFVFLPWTVESCFGAGVTNLNQPRRVISPSQLLRVSADCIPLGAIVNKNQCETRGLYMLLVIHCWIGDVRTRLPGCFYFPIRKLNYNF